MGHHLPVVVFPDGHDVDAHAGQLQGVRLDEGELLPAHIAVDPQRGEGPAVFENGFVVHGEGQVDLRVEGLQLLHEPLEVLHVLGEDHHVEGRPVLHENDPPGIEDDPPHRLHLADADAVVFGSLEEILPLDDLQVPQPQDEQAHGHEDHPEEKGESLSVHARVIPDKLIGLLQHERLPPGD